MGPGRMLPLGWENLGRFLGKGQGPRGTWVEGQPVCLPWFPSASHYPLDIRPVGHTEKGLHSLLLGNKPPERVLCPCPVGSQHLHTHCSSDFHPDQLPTAPRAQLLL